MEISDALDNILKHFFDYRYARSSNLDENIANATSNSCYNKFVEIDFRASEIEVPIIYYGQFTRINDNLNDKYRNELIEVEDRDLVINIPIFVGQVSQISTSNTMLLKTGERTYRTGLLRIESPKITYHLGKGMMLDSNLVPMLVCVHKIELDRFRINKLTKMLYLSPDIFSKSDMLSMLITRKLIPLLERYGIQDIRIKNLDNYFKTSVPPKIEDILKGSINEFIVNNAQEITDNIFV